MKTKSILIIDNEPAWLTILYEFLLLEAGIKSFTARNKEEALKVLKESPVDLVLMDMHLETVGGLKLLKQIRSNYGTTKIVVFFEGYLGLSVSPDELKTLGADYILKKTGALKHLPQILQNT